MMTDCLLGKMNGVDNFNGCQYRTLDKCEWYSLSVT